MTNPKTTSLNPGSGGARGLAHIGVIREREQRGYVISSVVGCSIGALIGGFHAAGKLDAYESWVTMQSAISRYRLASYPPDMLVDIPRNLCKSHAFYKAEQLIEAGGYWAREYLDR